MREAPRVQLTNSFLSTSISIRTNAWNLTHFSGLAGEGGREDMGAWLGHVADSDVII